MNKSKHTKETIRKVVSILAIIVGILIMPAVYAQEQEIVLPKPETVWVSADPSNYLVSNRPITNSINYIVIHDIEGSYQSAINKFKNPNPSHASAQYVISKTGEITQMVEDKDIAWHAGNNEYSKHTIGIEHEGFADKCQFTEKEYMASARLVRWLAWQYAIPLNHLQGIAPADPTADTGIIGHYQVPNPTDPSKGGGLNGHYDPGDCWDWNHYSTLLTEGLYGSYYNEPIYRNNINTVAIPDAVKVDSTINFNWHPGNNIMLPPEILDDGWWSADWTGYIYAPWDGIYWFKLYSDDGSWLYIDGDKIVDNGGDHAPREVSGQIELKKGYHSILVKYFESLGGDANINLQWMPPGETVYKIVPKEVFSVVALQESSPILKVSNKVPANMNSGNAMTYTLYYQNYGSMSASNAVLEDTISLLEVDFISASDGGVYDPGTGKVTWKIDSVEAFPTGMGSRTITVRIKSDVASGFLIKNTATITYGSDSFTANAHTMVTKSSLPPDVSVGPITGNTGGNPSVFWRNAITFSYYSACAAGVVITIHYSDENYLVETMTKSPDNMWTYTVPFFEPEHGEAKVTYTIAGCDKTSTLTFSIYIDPAGFIYDMATGKRIANATVWLQQPDGQGNWYNVETGQTPAIMQPDTNPLITNQDGQYQWDVLNGTYRIHVEAKGYYPEDSIAVNIPPPVTDLNVGLTHLPDDVSPTTTISLSGTQGNNNWYISNVEVSLTATDNEGGSGVNIIEYSFDSIVWNIYTVPFNITSEGITTVYYRSIDYADNSETVKTQTISIDKTLPNISITGVTNNSYYNSNVTVYVNITDVNLYNQSVTLNGYPYINGTNITAEGSYTLVASAADLAGNSALETLNFVIDKTPPEANISFNTTTKNITVYNNETGSEASYIILPTKKIKDSDGKEHNEDKESGWNLGQYALRDQANNSFVLILNYKNEGKEAKVEIIRMQYNNATVITVNDTSIEAEYSVDKSGLVKELEQKIKAQKQFEIEAKYSLKKNQTEIKVKTSDQKEEKETRPGLVILEILTDKGSLKYSY